MSIREEARLGFQEGADAYERGRPGYPQAATQWLIRQLGLKPGKIVLDVGAGTGKLTRELVPSGATVIAVEPVPRMRAVLERIVPGARSLDGTAEALPLEDGSVDAVVVAQAFHWFDGPAAVAEFHRVLKPEGRLALIWNRRMVDQPLHQEIKEIIEPYRRRTPSLYGGEWRHPVMSSGRFAAAGELQLPSEQVLDAEGLLDRIGSISFIAALPAPERDGVLDRVRALTARTAQPMMLGYLTEAYVYAPG